MAAVAVVAYGRATDDKRAAERDLVRVERELAVETARADAAESDADSERTRADDAEATAEQQASDLDDRDDELEDYRTSAIDFLALTVELGVGIPSGDAECIAEAFVSDRGAEALAAISSAFLTGSTQFEDDLQEFAEPCGVDPELLVSQPLEPGDTYGDNPTLDALYDACRGGRRRCV